MLQHSAAGSRRYDGRPSTFLNVTQHYVHVLTGENPVLEWLKGSALQALVGQLPAELKPAFLSDVGSRLRAAYPPTGSATLFPFPRVFFVAARPA